MCRARARVSLVFDTLYAEGQRRYVETFSPYARQFLDRMDKPQVDRIDGIPPAIAIDQTNPVRTSRSTVGTMTELNDHVKLLFARAAELYCRGCGAKVVRDTPESIYAALAARAKAAGDPRLVITFPVTVPKNFSEAEVQQMLESQGYARIHARSDGLLEVVQTGCAFPPPGNARDRSAGGGFENRAGEGERICGRRAGNRGQTTFFRRRANRNQIGNQIGQIGDRPPFSEGNQIGDRPPFPSRKKVVCPRFAPRVREGAR